MRIICGASIAYNHTLALFGAFLCLCAEVRGSLMRDPCIYMVVGLRDRAFSRRTGLAMIHKLVD